MTLKDRIVEAVRSGVGTNSNIARTLGANEPSVRRATRQLAETGRLMITRRDWATDQPTYALPLTATV